MLSPLVPAVYRFVLPALVLVAGLSISRAVPASVYATQFEAAQGYNINLDLAGQNGWTKFGTGGIGCNGLVNEFFPGQGQQAYIGFTNGVNTLFLFRPINFSPIASGLPLVRFSTLMSIEDSTNGKYDFFQWSVYNITSNRLLTLDFDNDALEISYALDGDDAPLIGTGVTLAPGSNYLLTVTMNFASNRWSATLGPIVLVSNLPMSTTGLPLTLGDVDAVWELNNTNAPGNNFMLFDNYTITAEALIAPTPPQPRLTLLGRAAGQTSLRLTGQNGIKFAIDASTNLINWAALRTNQVSDGSFDYIDTSSGALSRRFYRARWVP